MSSKGVTLITILVVTQIVMRILSYNIQAGINSSSYTSYSYQWHRQFLPDTSKRKTLTKIAQFIEAFDIVCLQEIDLGGLRNAFQSQATQLFEQTKFKHMAWQVNRRVSKLSIHGNLILSKHPIETVINLPLPSRIPGRGILAIRTTFANKTIIVANVHLSLGKLDQYRQLRFIRTKLSSYDNVILMGDFNCSPDAKQLQILTDHRYRLVSKNTPTFPTWKPKKALDHILIKGDIEGHSQTIDFTYSDHLPVAVDLH